MFFPLVIEVTKKMTDGMTLKELAAMVLICDPHAQFSHNLDLRNVSLHWILDPQQASLPRYLHTLDTLNPRSMCCLNSPRSALVALRLGISMKDLVVPNGDNAAAERPEHKFQILRREYAEICRSISLAEMLDKIRKYKFGVPLECHKEDRDEGFRPISSDVKLLLDEAGAAKVRSCREKSLAKMRRNILQRETLAQQTEMREHTLADEGSSNAVRMCLGDKLSKPAQCPKESSRMEEVKRLRSFATQGKEDDFRQRQQKVDDRLKMREKLSQTISNTRRQETLEKRSKVQKQCKTILREKTEQLISHSEMVCEQHNRETERRIEETKTRNALLVSLRRTRQSTAVVIASLALEEARAREDVVMRKSDQRKREIEHCRAQRMRERHRQTEEKNERNIAARSEVERKVRAQSEEFALENKKKLERIQNTIDDQKFRLNAKHTSLNQNHLAKIEEQRRVSAVREFTYIGHVNDTNVRAQSVELEKMKKYALNAVIKDERQAMQRVEVDILKDIENREIVRRKNEFHVLCNS